MKMRKVLSLILVLAFLLPLFVTVSANAADTNIIKAPYADDKSIEKQRQSKWKTPKIGCGTLYADGCAIFALVNAVYALNGSKIDIMELANWACKKGWFNNDEYGAGTVGRSFYSDTTAKEFKDAYFKFTGKGSWGSSLPSALVKHLKNEGVAIGHMYYYDKDGKHGHYVALVGYDCDKGAILVYDSAPDEMRYTKNGFGWLSESEFNTNKANVDQYYLLSSTKPSADSSNAGSNKISTLEISPTKNTYTISKGSICNIGVKITSNYNLTKVIGSLDGKVYTTITNSGTTCDIGNYKPNGLNSFDGTSLSVGSHTLKITATDSSGKSATATITINVKGKFEGETTPIFRLYNPNSGEHFFTGSKDEYDNLVNLGWEKEGVAFNAPTKDGNPVYRLYNPNADDHHYTMSAEERDDLVVLGWIYEGVAFNSAPIQATNQVTMFRLFNPKAESGAHHYTGSEEERDYLVSLGWNYEGVGFIGIK